jgi:hypothetical protein
MGSIAAVWGRPGECRRLAPHLHVPILGQRAPAELPLGDALEPGSLEVVGFDAPLGGGRLRQEPLEDAPRHPDHTPVLADLDPELNGLALGIPPGVLGGIPSRETVPLALSC